MYFSDVRILKVNSAMDFLNELRGKEDIQLSQVLEQMPTVSIMRQYFFVLEIFKHQIFSMDWQLQVAVAGVLAVNRMECCVNKGKYDGKYDVGTRALWDCTRCWFVGGVGS